MDISGNWRRQMARAKNFEMTLEVAYVEEMDIPYSSKSSKLFNQRVDI